MYPVSPVGSAGAAALLQSKSRYKSGRISARITGGVSYDTPIVSMAEKIAAKYDKKVFCHDRVPNGDGGISTGQAAIALHRL